MIFVDCSIFSLQTRVLLNCYIFSPKGLSLLSLLSLLFPLLPTKRKKEDPNRIFSQSNLSHVRKSSLSIFSNGGDVHLVPGFRAQASGGGGGAGRGAVRRADLAGGDDRAGDRVGLATTVDRARVPRPTEQTTVRVDRSAWVRRTTTLACFHRSVGFFCLSEIVVKFQGEKWGRH